ncbi:MAG: hypothetical protein PWQ37_2367 [Candidatus Petromonas sp.]|jgi:acylphosphatase|nr:hypothetical protein [Candidatus Petromonas sp.]
MKKIQVTLLVEESKELIARAILEHKKLKTSLKSGKVILKGGTTISKISEKIIGIPLRISGRISERGTVSSLINSDCPHTILIEKNKIRNIDNSLNEEFNNLTENDLVIIGANAIDVFGNAAMMAGSPGGGNVGQSMALIYTERVNVIIAAGLEKLIPGNINEVIKNSSRKDKVFSTGMGVGMFPIYGELITEVEAIQLLADVNCQVIGAGGLYEAKGSTTLEIWGEDEEINKIIETIKNIKTNENKISGEMISLQECEAFCESCGRHEGCSYKKRQLKDRKKAKLGIITIGQSPRKDLTDDIAALLSKYILISEKGVLDKYSYQDVLEKFSPKENENILVSRMRDGKQVILSEQKILEEMQTCIDELEKEVDIVLILCTGKFLKFKHNKPLLIPQRILHSTVSNLSDGKKIGAIVPEKEQIKQMKEWWSKVGVNLKVEAASPYKDIEKIREVASKFKDEDIDYIVLDCMGYSQSMKKIVMEESGKMVILPRTLIARVVNELIG